MNWQTLKLLRILCDRRITAVPLRVLGELRRRGKRRMPDAVEQELLDRQRWGGNTWRLVRQWLGSENLTRHNGRWMLNSFLPPFPSPAFDRMFENLLSGRELSPVSAFLAVTWECPGNCRYCSAGRRRPGYLTTAQWRQIIASLRDGGVSIIGFTGGEPLTRSDLAELIRTAADGGCTTILFTSGAGLNPDRIKQLQEAGLWSLCVSLDHDDPAAFDAVRGRSGAWQDAVTALQRAKKAGFYTMIGSVAGPEFVEQHTYEQIHRLGARLGVDEYRLVEQMPCGKALDFSPDAFLNGEQIQQLRKFHQTANQRGLRPKVCAFNQVESPELFGCGGGSQHLYIDAAGEVCPCDFTPLSFGNVTREAFGDIWTRMTAAMAGPRRECFIRKHHALLQPYAELPGALPLTPDASCQICRQAGTEPYPDYFQMVTGRTGRKTK